jgi:hypothetical protein
MSDINALEHALLSRARNALEPTDTDRERNQQQLLARIAATSLVAAASATPSLPTGRLRHLVDSHLIAMGTVAAAAGLVAFGGGYLVGHHHRETTVKTIIEYVPAPNNEGVQRSPAAVVHSPQSPPSLTSFPDRGRSGTGAKAAASPAASTAVTDNALSEELDLLRRAERTIRAGDAMVALGLLGELDQRFPKGKLLEERAAARVMANCQLTDESSARSMGQSYLAAHPQSVYAARVRSICHLDSKDSMKDSHGGGD